MPTVIKSPDLFTEDTWEEKLKPVPNPYNPGMGFDYGDGSCLMLAVDLQRYLREHNLSDDHVWTIVEADGDLFITHGFHYVNALGYIVTENAPRFSINYDIPIEF